MKLFGNNTNGKHKSSEHISTDNVPVTDVNRAVNLQNSVNPPPQVQNAPAPQPQTAVSPAPAQPQAAAVAEPQDGGQPAHGVSDTVVSKTTPMPSAQDTYSEVNWSSEQKRALLMVKEQKPGDAAPITQDDADQIFEHLAPPKKSVIKILLLIFFVLALLCGAAFGVWYYWEVNHATFEYELQTVVILQGQSVSPGEFLPESEKDRGVTAEFQNPDFRPLSGRMTVGLTLKLGLRTLEADTAVCIMLPEKEIAHEYKEDADPMLPSDFITNTEIARNIPYELIFTEPPLALSEYEVGEHILKLALNNAPFEVLLTVTDTTPPTATRLTHTVMIGEFVTPEDFITDISDHSPISSIDYVFFPPDTFSPETQDVVIAIEDIYGNRSEYAGTLVITLNQTPPIFTGIPELIEGMAGRPIAYEEGVSAYDDIGREIGYWIDDSDVDIDSTGIYTVRYITEDLSGLEAVWETTVYIIEADPLFVDKWIDDKLAEIFRDGMTQTQQARAILEAVRRTMLPGSTVSDSFMQSDDPPTISLYEAANRAIQGHDFYQNYYALSELMLTRAGIPNMRIERRESSKYEYGHIWNLINPDDRGWHHFDSVRYTYDGTINAMQHCFTNADAKRIEDFMNVSFRFGSEGFYDYDPELYTADIK
ncbi:MAG: hypothetical protein FWH17_04060 [Oscillospiraceae bacterium]|nr:hypothetical protein [Oscillospiraceae bacterium]